VTLGSTTGLAAGWEVRRTSSSDGADPAVWTRIATVVNATSVTLITGGYRGKS
jgi:hypothetical protein